MNQILLHPDIPSVNGAAHGRMTARTQEGVTLHTARGDWFSDVTRRRFCSAVAEKLFPGPRRQPKEPVELFNSRREQSDHERHEAMGELDTLLLHTLDGLEAMAKLAALGGSAHQSTATADSNREAPAQAGHRGGGPFHWDGNEGENDQSDLYVEAEGGIYYRQPTRDGEVLRPLTNFTAHIVADVIRDDGADRQHCFQIEVRQPTHPLRQLMVPAAQFMMMNWPIEHLGISAIVFAGAGAKDHARAAIQWFSRSSFVARTVYAHTGWREIDGKLAFLHAGGAIGSEGEVEGVEVVLPESMTGFRLPKPPAAGSDLARCVRASLGILSLGPEVVTYPLLAAVYRAPLGDVDAAQHLAGGSGVFKSELAALCQQHFGSELDARRLPASWSSTENALEQTAHAAKDVLLVVDDFAPGGTRHDVQRLHQKADRLIRAQGNHSGRQRMRPDGTLRAPRPPRGLVLSTGEDVPQGHSLRARMLVNEVSPAAIDPRRLTECQAHARDGLYAGAMAGYVQWLASRKWAALSETQAQASVRTEVEQLRSEASGGNAEDSHRRTPGLVANLALGLKYLLEFAVWAGAIGTREAEKRLAAGYAALQNAAAGQASLQSASEPTERFASLLAGAVHSGNAHFAAADGGIPPVAPGSWGWRRADAGGLSTEGWQPKGERVGWVNGDIVYLEPEASYKAAQQMAAGSDALSISAQTLRKRMADKGLLIRDMLRQTLTLRRVLEGATKNVLQLASGAMTIGTLCRADSRAAGEAI